MLTDVTPLQSWFGMLSGRRRDAPHEARIDPDAHLPDAAQKALATLFPAPEADAESAPAVADMPATDATLPVLADISFAEDGEASTYLLGGWSHQEPPFIWAIDFSSEIALPETLGWSRVTLEIDVFPCLLPPYRTIQRLRVQADGREIGRAEIRAAGRISIETPAETDWRSVRKLTFIHPDGVVAGERPGEDGRCLSIAFRRLTFRGQSMQPEAMATPIGADGELPDADLALQFEGLGGTHQGCEFGIVQRELGAEPLGLLRWSLMNADSLAEALEARFDGVGTPEQTVLDYFAWPTYREYRTEDRRFLMSMHTWVREDEKPYDAMYTMICRRLRFLRDKLLDDLAGANKIFVFKLGDRPCTAEQLLRIHAALRSFGPNTLLHIRLADDTHPSGTVEELQEGLLVGYISHFNQTLDGDVVPVAIDSWRAVCRKAYRIWQDRKGKEGRLF